MADVLIPDLETPPNSLEAKLAQFMLRSAGKRLSWGVHDPGLWLADWAMFRDGLPDPAANFREAYRSRVGAERSCQWPLIVGRIARSLGWRMRRGEARLGDVGLMGSAAAGAICGAIRGAQGWFMMSDFGIVRLPAEVRVVAAWGPP